MRIETNGSSVRVWASARDTYSWAHKPGAAWPCSTLSGHRFYAEFSRGDLVDFTLDGRTGDVNAHEFAAFLTDKLGTDRPGDA
jgi:hypothetical protein